MGDWPISYKVIKDATLNGVLYGAGAGISITTTAAPATGQFLGETVGVPTWKTISINLAAAVTGILPIINGGTGASTLAGASIAVTTGKLSQFAATTSAELLGIISDATGTGTLVFGTSPQFNQRIGIGFAALAGQCVVFGSTVDASGGTASVINIGSLLTLKAAANNDILNAFFLNPGFNDNSKTGVVHYLIRSLSTAPVFLTGSLSVFGVSPPVQQTSGADLTNNVTSGGGSDTIANFTDLTTYSNDAAAIRNNFYQLARKLKQINDGLRLYGFFT